jgi:hypothetical protein
MFDPITVDALRSSLEPRRADVLEQLLEAEGKITSLNAELDRVKAQTRTDQKATAAAIARTKALRDNRIDGELTQRSLALEARAQELAKKSDELAQREQQLVEAERQFKSEYEPKKREADRALAEAHDELAEALEAQAKASRAMAETLRQTQQPETTS